MREIGVILDGYKKEIASAFWNEWTREQSIFDAFAGEGQSPLFASAENFLKLKYNSVGNFDWLEASDRRGRESSDLNTPIASYMKASMAAQLKTLEILRDKSNSAESLAKLTDVVFRLHVLDKASIASYTAILETVDNVSNKIRALQADADKFISRMN